MNANEDGYDTDDVLSEYEWCGIYTRQSRDRNDEFNSCDAQFWACFDYLRPLFDQGWACNGRRYDDKGVSGDTRERPGLQKLFRDIDDGRVDRVVIQRLDRLSRRIADFGAILEELRKRNVSLTVISLPELGTSAENMFVLNIIAAFAEFEQEMTRERMAEARSALKRRGRRVAGVVPYGYTADPMTKQLVIHRREADRVRKMFEWAAEGMLPREIAETANQRRWRTKKRTTKQGKVIGGGMWTARQVLATLSNPVYAGRIRDGEQLRSGAHDALVAMELFVTVRAQIESRRTRKPRRSKTPSNWPLKGLLYCGRCGRKMSPNTSRHGTVRYRYFQCRSTAGGQPPCRGVRVRAWDVLQYVINTIAEIDPDSLQEDNPTFKTALEKFRSSNDRERALSSVLKKVIWYVDDEKLDIVLRDEDGDGR